MILENINSPSDLKKLSLKELNVLADEIRTELMRTVPVTGGHLAANLGVVELTIALHYVLNMPNDKIVWDVGHQSYVHKMLTGRKLQMETMRQLGGLSGFPKPCESEYDSFGTGHSSTAISAALGMAVARNLNGENYNIAAVVGDGSMTGGLSFEGLNNCGQEQLPMMIILNDNGMSISKNVGALSHYFSRIRSSKRYNITKISVKNKLTKMPVIGRAIVSIVERIKIIVKAILVPNVIFEQFNITYIGTVDGHDIKQLIEIFERAKKMDTPVLIHVKTKKGKGNRIIEENPAEFHSVSENCCINDVCGKIYDEQSVPTSFSLMLGKTLSDMADNDDRIVAITAAMCEGTGLDEFAKKHPDRFFDVGIAEQHELTFAAGLAISGKKPFAAVYSSFLQRAYDQVVHDICIQNLPVTLCIDRAGLTGRDGETHNGQFDMAFLQSIPNITVFAPSTLGEFSMLLHYAAAADGPVAIRYGKAKPCEHALAVEKPFEWTYTDITGDEKVVIFACGTMVEKALHARSICETAGIKTVVVNMVSVKPLNYAVIDKMNNIHNWIVAEDGCITGGIGSTISLYASEHYPNVRIKNIGIPDIFVPHGSVDEVYEICGMTEYSIADAVNTFLRE